MHDQPMGMIRGAAESDLPVLQDIERAAGLAFADIGMPEIAADEPLTLDELLVYLRGGRAWVCVEAADRPIAYLIAEVLDGSTHVEQVSVHPDHARQGIGRALLDFVAAWSLAQGQSALTLTTFSDVPWNAPYYERCGFRRLSDAEISPGLRAIRAEETERGLDRWPRTCMRRDLA